MQKLKTAGFVTESITDGPGIRFTVFCQGCPHKCKGCHNPQTWDENGGEWHTVDEIFNMISANPLVGGVTFSGGEPFMQAAAYAELAEMCIQKGLEVACYTGFTFEYLLQNGTEEQKKLLSLLDVLVDGPFKLEQRSLNLKFYGSRNQRVLNAKESLKAQKAVLMKDGRWNEEESAFPPVEIDYKLDY